MILLTRINLCKIRISILKNTTNTFKNRRESWISKRWVLNFKYSTGNLWKSYQLEPKRDWKRSLNNIWTNVSKTIIEARNKILSNLIRVLLPLLIKHSIQLLIQINTLEKSRDSWKSIQIFKRTSNVSSRTIWSLRVNKSPLISSQLIHKFLQFGKI